MSNLNANSLASASTGNAQSTSDRIFAGVGGVGTNLPLLGGDSTMTILLGRMGGTSTQTQLWEQALKLSRSLGSFARMELSTEWVNENFGINPLPPSANLDLKAYEANLGLNLKPFILNFEGAFSSFYTGVCDGIAASKPLEAPGGQASLSFYPFTFYYFGISENFANFQSKVGLAGLPWNRYGISWTQSSFEDAYGMIGEVDTLVSDRYGWRANLGWTGRQQDFMKSWPGFLDFIVVNMDVSQKREYVSMTSPEGYNVIEPFNIISFYYPEDEGIWGRDFWGGWTVIPRIVTARLLSTTSSLSGTITIKTMTTRDTSSS